MHPHIQLAFSLTLASSLACGTANPGGPGGPSMRNRMTAVDAPAASPVLSSAILARDPVANEANVRHILISWKALAESFGGGQDPRASERSQKDAENVIMGLLGQLKAGGDFGKLMAEHSEDLGSATSGRTITVTPSAGLVLEFKQLSLRLNPGERGVCQSIFGFHLIERVD